jgi:hypothetical protein
MAYLSCKLTISKLRLSHYIILMTQQEHSYHENLQINFQGPTDGHSTQKSLQIWKEEVDIYVLLKKLCQIFLRWKLPYIKSLTILSDLTLDGKHLRVLVQILLYNSIQQDNHKNIVLNQSLSYLTSDSELHSVIQHMRYFFVSSTNIAHFTLMNSTIAKHTLSNSFPFTIVLANPVNLDQIWADTSTELLIAMRYLDFTPLGASSHPNSSVCQNA